jgi:hypothetical protein
MIMRPKQLIELASTAPSADNSQPWQFLVDSKSITCHYKDRTIKRSPFGPLSHGSLMAAGALLENFNTLRPEQGEKPQINISDIEWSFSVNLSSWQMPLDSISANLLQSRHTNRHPYKALKTRPVVNESPQFSSRRKLLTDQQSIKLLTKALVNCSLARFNNPELHEWLFSSLRWTPEEVDSGTGLDFKTLHLPPGGRQFMQWITPWERMKLLNRFGIYHVLAAADAALFSQAPSVIAFIGGQSTKEILDCGQLMQHTWLSLNSQGIAVHPYYVLTDLTNRLHQKKLNAQWSSKVLDAEAIAAKTLQLQPHEQVHMLFRIGLPVVTPVRSRRLPFSSLIEQ